MVTLLSVSLKYQTESLISALGLLLKGLKALCIEMIHATQDYAHNNINTPVIPPLKGISQVPLWAIFLFQLLRLMVNIKEKLIITLDGSIGVVCSARTAAIIFRLMKMSWRQLNYNSLFQTQALLWEPLFSLEVHSIQVTPLPWGCDHFNSEKSFKIFP